MKKTLKLRALVVFIAILFLLPMLAACGGNDVSPTPESTQGTPPQKTPQKTPLATEITLSQNDAQNYNIIMPKGCESTIRDAAINLLENMKTSGYELSKCTFDGGATEADIPENACEILIGQTNRSQNVTPAEGLRKDDFIIAAEGNRIIILGGSPESLIDAMDYFYENYVKETTSICISEAQTFTGEYDLANMIDLAVNGSPIHEYSISIPVQTSVAFDYAVTLLSNMIVEKTAYLLPIKHDEVAPKKTIRIELSKDLQECEYSYTMQGDVLTVQATDRTMFYAIRNLITLVTTSTAGVVDFADTEMGTFLMNPEVPLTHPTLEGKLPVALCDQQNDKAVVIDFAAADPTASSAIIWEWNPTRSLGFTGTFKNRIDEFKLRYSTILNQYIVCTTSSSGFIGIAEYPSGKMIWEHDAAGYGPHSIDYLPTGNVAVALSGNGAAGKQEIRIYKCDEDGIPTTEYIRDELISAHGIVWDNDWGILWALGATELIAYEVGGTPQEPTLTRISGLGCTVKTCGHDLSISATDAEKLYLSSNAVYVFNKYTNTLDANFDGKATISGGDVKCIAVHTDGSVLRTHAASVYAQHDTDTLEVYRKNEAGEWVKTSYKFTGRAFYKARPFILC